jgi:hypothetical protein
LPVENKTINSIRPNTRRIVDKRDLSPANMPSIQGHDSVAISFGASGKSNSTRTWKQYFTDLYNKFRDQIHKLVNSIKSFFKKPAKNQTDSNTLKDASDSSSVNTPKITQPSQPTNLPEGADFSKMTPEERSSKIRQLIEYKQSGKTYDDLSAEDQYFLCVFISEALKQPDPAHANLGKAIADLYEIPIEDT